MADDKDKLATLFPDRKIMLAAKEFSLRPFSFGQIPAVLTAAGAIIGDLQEINLDEMDEQTVGQLSGLVFKHFDKISYLISLATGETKETIDALPMDAGLTLALQVFEMNKTFFVERVAPLLPKEILKKRGRAGAK